MYCEGNRPECCNDDDDDDDDYDDDDDENKYVCSLATMFLATILSHAKFCRSNATCRLQDSAQGARQGKQEDEWWLPTWQLSS